MQMISNCTHDAVKKAAKALKDGHLVAFPTETVYGLGADAANEKAVSQIYAVKGRPTDHPLIVHISSISQISKWAIDLPEYAMKLARDFWPGPMTLILKRSELAKDFITGGQNSVGLRVPNQPLALSLLSEFEKMGGSGVAAPSANKFGAVSPTTSLAVAEEIGNLLNQEDLIIDGGSCEIGIESTIIDCTQSIPRVLRPGPITDEIIGSSIDAKTSTVKQKQIMKTSGLFINHYSPKAKVRLNQLAKPGEGFIAMANMPTPRGAHRLASPKNLEDFAKVLYEALRNADRMRLDEVKVMLPSGNGLADAIRDRLNKSSTKNE